MVVAVVIVVVPVGIVVPVMQREKGAYGVL